MERKTKFTAEVKLDAVMQYLDGKGSLTGIAKSLGTATSSVQAWVRNYQSMGKGAFETGKHKGYPASLKEEAVAEYLEGGISQKEICRKYQIKSPTQLKRWILKYNGHEKLKTTSKGGNCMTKGRKTTFDERVEIVSWHLENGAGYEETAERFKISYQQAYSWVRKYQERGVDGLQDHRGKHKPEAEMSEVEKLRAENRILKAENQYKEAENLYLKKVREIGRRR